MATALTPVQRYQGVHKESAGYKLLASMGWKEGEGLGALGQGIKEHIRVKKNYENWGVGAIESAERSRDWSAGMLEFHRVLSNLSEVTSVHASRAESDSEDDGDDDSKVTEKEEPVAKVVTHRGRFKRRESAKDVKKYGGEDLAAILGGGQDPFAALASAAQTSEEDKRAQSTETVSTSKKKKEKSSKKEEKRIKEQQQALPRIDPEAWWGNYFERSGNMGSAPSRKKKEGGITVHSFHEDDQEALYNRVQTGATQGHQGLGISALPKKVAGTRWQGTKIRLDSDSDGENAPESVPSSSEEEEITDSIVVVMPSQARGAKAAVDMPATTTQHEFSADDAAKDTIKWKKLVLRTLRKSEKKSLRHSKLIKAVAEAAGVPKKERMTVQAAVETVINGSKRLRLERDRVHLA